MKEQLLDELSLSDSLRPDVAIASKTKRFINYVIDVFTYTFFLMLLGVIAALILEDDSFLLMLDTDINPISGRILEYVLGWIVVIVYYTFMEYNFQGKTIGKWITKTRALTIEGENLDFKTVLKRSAIRIVPFEAFSFLGEDVTKGWHDNWSKTIVIDEAPKS